jgi:hypothetical protein
MRHSYDRADSSKDMEYEKSKVETDINLTRQKVMAQAWKKLQLMTKKTYVSVQAVQIRFETQYPKIPLHSLVRLTYKQRRNRPLS